MNVIIQCLVSFKRLNNYFLNENFKKIKNHTKSKTKEFCLSFTEIMFKMLNVEDGVNFIDPINFKKLIKKDFTENKQHDCQEFLRFLLSNLQEELNPYDVYY